NGFGMNWNPYGSENLLNIFLVAMLGIGNPGRCITFLLIKLIVDLQAVCIDFISHLLENRSSHQVTIVNILTWGIHHHYTGVLGVVCRKIAYKGSLITFLGLIIIAVILVRNLCGTRFAGNLVIAVGKVHGSSILNYTLQCLLDFLN